LNIYTVNGIFAHVNIKPTDLFAALSHDTRLRCLLLLHAFDELCVCELTGAIGASQPHMSRHLAQLREARLVSDRREGLWIYYCLNPDLPDWVAAVLDETAQGVFGIQPFSRDLATMAASPDQPVAARCA